MTSKMSGENPTSELSCHLCRTSHSSEWELKEHLWSLLHHVKLEQKAKNSLHQCVLCQTSCENLVDYGRHLNELKHKQALEKAKEKKAKPKLSHPRSVLPKGGKQKAKRSLLPNSNWHLNPVNQHSLRVGAKLQPQFGNWNALNDWQRNGQKEFNSFQMQVLHPPPPFPNDHYWNNGNYCDTRNGFHSFYKNDRNSSDLRKNQNYLPHSSLGLGLGLVESNKPSLSSTNQNPNLIQPLMSKKCIAPSGHQSSNKLPTKHSADFNQHLSSESSSSSVKSSSQTANNLNLKCDTEEPIPSKTTSKSKKKGSSPPRPKVTLSDQDRKPKTDISKLRAKGGIVKTVVSSMKKDRSSQKDSFFLDKNGKTNPSQKISAEIAGGKPGPKKHIVAASVNKKTDNFTDASVNKITDNFTDASVNKKTDNFTDASVNKKTDNFTDASVNKKTDNFTDASVNKRTDNFTDASVNKKTDNFTGASVNKKNPSPSKPRAPLLLKNGKSIETDKSFAAVDKTKNICRTISPAERNSSVKPNDSDPKLSKDTNSTEDSTSPLKRNIDSTDAPDLSPVPNKKQKTLPKSSEVKSEITEPESPNLLTAINSECQQENPIEKNDSSRRNDGSEKVRSPGILSALNPTREKKSLSAAALVLAKNKNGFKVNNELVTKLHRNLIGQNPIRQFKSRVKSPEHQSDSKDEANPPGKQGSGAVRQEELVKMMKLPRLNRKEKMHLSSLLQSYTKSQNKKLAVPRLTMQLSGMYNDGGGGSSNSSNNNQDPTSAVGIELPAGMEEQIAHLIKRENLDTASPFEKSDRSNLGISAAQLEESGLQTARNDSSSTAVRQKGSGRRKTNPAKSKTNPSSSLPSSSSSSSSSTKTVVLNNNNSRLSDVVSSLVEPSSSQPTADVQEATNTSPLVSDTQVLNDNNNNSSSSCNLPNPLESSLETNSSAQETTGTPSNSTENLPAASSNNNNSTENIFNKVYLLTLREEQIRSSILDQSEKMNYLRKLIEDSQMALQGCCVEHKRLVDEETSVRDQRLKILQDAISNKNVNTDSSNGAHLSQPCQTDASRQISSISQPQLGNQLNSQAARPSSYFLPESDVISSVSINGNQTHESFPHPHSSEVPSNTTSTFQSHVPPEALPSQRPSTIHPFNRNASSKQNQTNRTSPHLSPVAAISFGSDTTSTDNAAVSENSNTASNIGATVPSNWEPPFGLGPITIKQELPSPPSSSSERTAICSPSVGSNNTCNKRASAAKTFSEEGRLPPKNVISLNKPNPNPLSNNVRKQGLLSASAKHESITSETVEIKKENPTPASLAETKGPSPQSQLQPADSKEGSVCSVMTASHKQKRQPSDLQSKDVVCDETPKLSTCNDLNNSADRQSQHSAANKNPEAEPVINFESVHIKEEPVTPPPQVENEETFFVPRMASTENMNKNGSTSEENQTECQTGMKKTVETTVSGSSASNLLGSEIQNENPGKSRGMSMTYLGSMPNNFLERLTLSWKKQNTSATAIEASAQSPEHSFSDSESTSSRNICTFVQKSVPQFSVPAQMNPRVCLEPLNMKFPRKRTLSEPLSSSESASVSVSKNGSEEFQADLKRRESPVKKMSERGKSSCASKTDAVKSKVSDEPEVKRKNLRSRSREKEKKSKVRTDLPMHDDASNSVVEARFLDNKINDGDVVSNDGDNLKGVRIYGTRSDDASIDSESQPKNPVGTMDNLNQISDMSSDLSPRDLNPSHKFPASPMNILNNLSMLHVVRTKKFPRTHVNGSQQLPTFKGVSNPVNGLHVIEENLYVSYQGSSPCKFSIDSGECLQVYNCKPYSVQCMRVCRINKNKSYLFSGGASELLLVFDEVTGRLCSKIDTCRKIYSLHENWGNLFVGLADGGVTKVNLKSLRKTSELSYGSKPINCLATCTEAAQRLLCVGAYDASIVIVDAMTGLLLKTLHCYHRLLYSIKVHENLIFSCSSDKTLQVHDVTSGKLLRCFQDHTASISCLHVEDNLLVTGSHDKRLNVYNSSNPSEAPVIFFTSSKEPISCLAIHNNLAYCGNFFGHIETVQFNTGQKWVCKYNSCRLVFGQRKGLFYHLVNQHLQMTGLDRIQCLWDDCGEYICSVLDITEHCENHLNHHE